MNVLDYLGQGKIAENATVEPAARKPETEYLPRSVPETQAAYPIVVPVLDEPILGLPGDRSLQVVEDTIEVAFGMARTDQEMHVLRHDYKRMEIKLVPPPGFLDGINDPPASALLRQERPPVHAGVR